MVRYLAKSIWLLFFAVIICCCLYPLALWVVGQVFFPFTGQRQPGERARAAPWWGRG